MVSAKEGSKGKCNKGKHFGSGKKRSKVNRAPKVSRACYPRTTTKHELENVTWAHTHNKSENFIQVKKTLHPNLATRMQLLAYLLPGCNQLEKTNWKNDPTFSNGRIRSVDFMFTVWLYYVKVLTRPVSHLHILFLLIFFLAHVFLLTSSLLTHPWSASVFVLTAYYVCHFSSCVCVCTHL